MVSATDYPPKSRLSKAGDEFEDRPRKWQGFFAALAAPFRDMDDRALHKKRKHAPVRNNSKGNMFTPRAAAAPIDVPVRRFRHGDD
jgi:hypothetical protein